MDLTGLFAQVLNGLQYGLLLFLISSGLTLVFGVMGVINLAHGSLFMVGAYAAWAIARLTGAHRPNPEKLSEYECGFPAFEDSRARFDVRFYLVAILFIVFDLEAAFLFPWAVSLAGTGMASWIAMMIFLGELALGLAYAWKKGALEWE